MEKLKSKIKLKYNELDLVCRKRVDGIIYSVYISNGENFINFDSGINPDGLDCDLGILDKSFKMALDQLGYTLVANSNYTSGTDYTDDFDAHYYVHWFDEPCISFIDQLSPSYSSILIHQEKNTGIDEDLTPPDLIKNDNLHGFISECLGNFIESGYYRML